MEYSCQKPFQFLSLSKHKTSEEEEEVSIKIEEEVSIDEEEEDQKQESMHHKSDEGESEESEEEPVQKKPLSTPEFESSDSNSDETQNSPTASAFTVRPIISKPMENSPKHKKPTSKSTQLKPSAKRLAGTEQNEKDLGKKKSKVSNGDGEDGPIEEKKSAINRLWSEDDEIVILRGMIDYQSTEGFDPYSDMAAFHEFIKGSLHVDVSKNQLYDKIRRLKKKYQINSEKGENGKDPVFSRSHEQNSFKLSKKIWGGGNCTNVNGGDDIKVKSSKRKYKKDGKVVNNSVVKLMENKEVVLQEAVKGESKEEDRKDNWPKGVVLQGAVNDEIKGDEGEDFWSKYPRLRESLESDTSIYLSLPKDAKNFVKERISLIGRDKARQLEEKWKDIRVMEYKLYAKRIELIHEQGQLVVDKM